MELKVTSINEVKAKIIQTINITNSKRKQKENMAAAWYDSSNKSLLKMSLSMVANSTTENVSWDGMEVGKDIVKYAY